MQWDTFANDRAFELGFYLQDEVTVWGGAEGTVSPKGAVGDLLERPAVIGTVAQVNLDKLGGELLDFVLVVRQDGRRHRCAVEAGLAGLVDNLQTYYIPERLYSADEPADSHMLTDLRAARRGYGVQSLDIT